MDRDSIAKRAYEKYERRGRTHGRDLDDWLEAERELDQSSGSTTATEEPEPASVGAGDLANDKAGRRQPRRRTGTR